MRTSNGVALFALGLTAVGLASALAFDGAQPPDGVMPVVNRDAGSAASASAPPESTLPPGLIVSFSNLRVSGPALRLTPVEAFRWGAQALRIGNVLSGVRALDYAATNGHPVAQWKLGRMYGDGDGVKQDQLRAFGYFSTLADAHADETPGTLLSALVSNAFVYLGTYYLEGIPNSRVTADPERARKLFSYAASYFGDRDAQYKLARMYLEGNGVPKDPKLAVRWLNLAADKGQHEAQAVLGDLLFNGTDVPRHSALGLMWLTLARDSASTQEGWIVTMHDDASKHATDQDRELALTLLERRLRGGNTHGE
jgi:uncharacterized protein